MFDLQRIDSFGQTYLYIQKFLRYDSWHDTMPLNHYVTVHGIHSSHTCAFHSWRWCCRLCDLQNTKQMTKTLPQCCTISKSIEHQFNLEGIPSRTAPQLRLPWIGDG